MNNKSSSVNSMKLKKAIAASLALLILLHSQLAELHLVLQQIQAVRLN